MIKQTLMVLNNEFTIHRFHPNDTIPNNVFESEFYWIGKTDEEISIVCESNILLNSPKSESNWSILKIIGELDFSLVGILADISSALSKAEISIVALSTFNTDYIMIKTIKLEQAKKVLQNIGYKI